jgi:arylsulfatase A-like enzyme
MQPEVETLRARYNEFVRYCDKQFEDFITQLTKRGKLKNTVIILSSDHGESFEHGYLTHGNEHLYEQVTNIPLIIKEPDQSEGRIINDIAEQIDIPATILELAHIPVPSWMEGRSLVPLMRGKRLLSRPAFSMNFEKNPSRGHQITKGTIAVWEGDYKLIHYLQEKKSLLFNLKKDPRELNNLFDREPEIGKHLLTLIQDNLKKANERISRENK